MPTAVTVTDNSGVNRHDINFKGFSGIIFWLVLASTLLFLIAFATEGWAESGAVKVGLWKTCTCTANTGLASNAWFKASQAMFCIALIFLIVSMVLVSLYMMFHSINKNTVLFLVIGSCFLTVLFLLIGLLVFGIETKQNFTPSYSFVFACMTAIMCCIAGGLAIGQKFKSQSI